MYKSAALADLTHDGTIPKFIGCMPPHFGIGLKTWQKPSNSYIAR